MVKINELPYRILGLSDSPLTCTGFATCTKELLNGLSKNAHLDVHYLAHNYLGQKLMPGVEFEDGTKLNFKLHGHGMRPYCEDVIEPVIKDLKANIFYVCLDTFMLWPWFLNKNLTPAKTIFHFPSDGAGNLPAQDEGNDCMRILQKVDLPVAMSKFAQRQVKEKYNMEVPYIPLGVHTSKFFPFPAELKAQNRQQMGLFTINSVTKQKVQVSNSVLQNKFIIGSVFRNQPRKFPDRIVKTLKVLLHEKKVEDFICILHTDPTDLAAPFNIQYLANREGVGHKILFTDMTFYKGLPSEKMVNVYNLFDIFYLPTSGEGFGIPYLEAMSCGIPIVGTNYTTIPELALEDGQCGEVVDLVGTEKDSQQIYHNGEITGSWTVERGLADVFDAADKILKLKNSPGLIEQYGKVGREKAIKFYDWSVLIPQWEKLILDLIEK